MEKVDSAYNGSAETELHPTDVADLLRDLIGHEHHPDGVDRCGDGVQNQERRVKAMRAYRETGSQQDMPELRRRKPDGKYEQTGNACDQAERRRQNGVPALVSRPQTSRKREHAADNLPRQHIHDSTDERDGRINTRLRGVEEMFDQNNIEIVDDDLADKKDDRLQSFADACAKNNRATLTDVMLAGNADQISHSNRRRHGSYDTLHAIGTNENQSTDQLDDDFKSEIEGKGTEVISTLHEAATDS